MNHHYIDYMLKQRLQDDINDCKRRRLLKNAEPQKQRPRYTILKRLIAAALEKVSRLRLRRIRYYSAQLSHAYSSIHRKGGEV